MQREHVTGCLKILVVVANSKCIDVPFYHLHSTCFDRSMRQKKHKKIHRTLTFLKISHHFKEPYKVSCMTAAAATVHGRPAPHLPLIAASLLLTMQVVLDGNFVNALLQTKYDAWPCGCWPLLCACMASSVIKLQHCEMYVIHHLCLQDGCL